MELIESTFSGMSDRVEKDEKAKKQTTEQSLHALEGAEQQNNQEQNGVTTSDNGPEPNKNVPDSSSSSDDGDTPRRLPVAKVEKKPASPTRPPVTPRKMVIPSRRATFDNTRGATPSRSSVIPANTTQATDPTPQTTAVTPNEARASSAPQPQRPSANEAHQAASSKISQASNQVPSFETGQPDKPDASSVEAPTSNQTAGLTTHSNQPTDNEYAPASDQQIDLSTHDHLSPSNKDGLNSMQATDLRAENANELDSTQATDAPAENAEVFGNHQETDLAALARLSATYHDTSAAEAAWQAGKHDDEIAEQDTHILASTHQTPSRDKRQSTAEIEQRETIAAIATKKMATPVTPLPPVSDLPLEPSSSGEVPTTPLPVFTPVKPLGPQKNTLTRKRALLMVALLAILLVNATVSGFGQFFGPQGWGSVWNGHDNGGPNLLTQIAHQLQQSPTPGSKGTPTPPTPTQIVNLLMSNMTLDEKLGQMMMVQFMGQSYSTDLDTMINQYHVGSVLYFQFNIGSKSQLTSLNAEMQHNANLPLLVAVDQEGGTVDRLVNLDGAQPSASQIGASNNPNVAYQQGLKDARNLASYGFNLNLAPVVDVNNVYNPQLYDRTYGNNPTSVSRMAEKYLEGLQSNGKVLGTLKHFPGLGDVSTDPHYGLPALTRDLNSLNTIDWAPYSNLIKQGHVYSIMVTHEIVDALDKTEPSSLSPQVIDVLRKQMHFQGVIITDSLTMDSIHNFYTYGDAAAKAVEAGDDILMGADSPSTLAQMITGIKQAMNSGAITQQHIDDSVRRILLFKYEMGLLHV